MWSKAKSSGDKVDAAVHDVNHETADRIADEKHFWDESIQWMLPEDQTADSIIRIMDVLLAARRDRFGGR